MVSQLRTNDKLAFKDNTLVWTYDPRMPIGLWWALVVLAVLALAAYAWAGARGISLRRRCLLIALMALGFVGPFWIALNPIRIDFRSADETPPRLLVLVDGTLSMRAADSDEPTPRTRWEQAVTLATTIQPAAGVKVEFVVFDDDMNFLLQEELRRTSSAAGNPSSPTWPRGNQSDLGGALRHAIRDGNGGALAVLLLSDGAHNVGTSDSVVAAAREAHALDVPIYTTTIGGPMGARNLALSTRSPRMIAFPDQPLILKARLDQAGLGGSRARLDLLRDDEVLQSQTVPLSDAAPVDVLFRLETAPEAVLQRYRIVAAPLAQEATVADNEIGILVQRLDQPIGVLLLEGKPYWDSKFLARNLAADPNLELTSVVQLAAGRYLVQRHTRPAREGDTPVTEVSAPTTSSAWQINKQSVSPLEDLEHLAEYRLVVLGRDADAFLTPNGVESLRQWISRRGGCILCARGAPTNEVMARLMEILPVRWQASEESRFRTQFSRHARDAAVFDSLLQANDEPLSALPSLAVGALPAARPGLPQVLVQSSSTESGAPIPVVTYQPFGRGQAIVVEGSGMWRWAFLPPQHADKDTVYPALWQSLVQWIISQQDVMPGQTVAIRSDRTTFVAGEPVSATVVISDDSNVLTTEQTAELSVLLSGGTLASPRRLPLVASGIDSSLFRVDAGDLPVGSYVAQVVRGPTDEPLAKAILDVRDPWYEQLALDARPDLMRRLALESGGQTLAADEVTQVVERFTQRLSERRPASGIRTTMWDRPSVLMVTMSVWFSTWFLRRRQGLT